MTRDLSPAAYVRPPRSSLALGAITFRDRPFQATLDAAAGAGFDGVGVTVGQCLSALERGIPLDQLPVLVERAGLHVAELELVRLCEQGAVRHANDLVLDLAGTLDPDRVHVAAWTGEPQQIADAFAHVCAELPETPVAFEFMAYNAVPGFAAALDLSAATGMANASVVLDILHFFRTHASFEDVTPEAMHRVAVVQLSDVVTRPRGDELDEARHRRTYPGEGSLDSVEFVRRVRRTGVVPPISVEPINDAYEQLPLAVVADRAMVATARLLQAVEAVDQEE
ncbi:MAG: hypothetical protein AVDCRST_MAG33-2804 [uncultured Thermomicrobiales bacterium]|uniref:Xylose isomerase-like TIM barrel domain-containing protein n=1 Tax=uncultured Thermomicrobiales bacterium TaxID=1645740 RepID=A0A6J4VCU9_9BACT|nr:MAG: hypothetical protein AVDCRST_MAG33-2804 [uncultured Thermomicrobiales bacterium]